MTNWLVVYTTSAFECKWCIKVKELLNVYGFDFYEKDISKQDEYKKEFVEAGFRTVPQVYLEGTLIGGYETTKDYLRKTFFENYNPEVKARIIEELKDLE